MRKPIIFCLLISLFLACSATYAKPVKSKKEKTILNTTTIFILDGGRDYNKALEAVVPETWHVTPYKFMSVEEAQQYLDNDKFSFVARVTFERIGNLTPDEFECLAAFGALKSFQKIKSDQVVQREDLDLDHEKDVITTLPNSIERLNYLCIHGELYAGSKVKDMEARAGEVKTKTLYILKSQMGKNPEKFKQKAQKVYPYKIQYVDDNTLKKAVYNYDSTVCYIKRYNGSRWVIDAGTGMLLLYIPYNSDHYDFGPWHLKEMAKIMAKH